MKEYFTLLNFLIKEVMRVKEKIVFDVSPSMRRKDENGFLHVERSNITKEQVAPYWGNEIPGYEALGLKPEKVYWMYRPAEELEKAAGTFAGLPLTMTHKVMTAEDLDKDFIVGTVGTEAAFEAPYIVAPLVITDGEAIKEVESGNYREISASYVYTPVMEPGMFDGEHYDGRMIDIRGNHVALVHRGRAGHDVVVADSQIENRSEGDVQNMNENDVIAQIMSMSDEQLAAIREKLGIGVTADQSEQAPVMEEAPAEEPAAPAAAPVEDPAPVAEEQPAAASEEDAPAVNDYADQMKDCGLDAENPAESKAFAEGVKYAEGLLKEKGEQEKLDREHEAEGMKEEMAKQIAAAQDSAFNKFRDMANAAKDCRTVLGDVDVFAFDSAAGIYKKALTTMGVSLDGVPAEAYGAVLRAVRAQASAFKPAAAVAADSQLVNKASAASKALEALGKIRCL